MKIVVLFFILLTSLTALAQQTGVYEMSRPTRAMGMGGVITPVVSDGDAVFYNPAALANVKGINVQLADIDLGVNGMQAYDIAKDASTINNPSTQNGLFGKNLWIEGSDRSSVAIPYFGVGYYDEYAATVQLENPAYPQVDTYFRNDAGLLVGGALPIGPGTSIGVTAKQIRRWGGYDQNLGASQLANMQSITSLKSLYPDEGTGYGVDAAFMSTAQEVALKPTLSIVWQDIGDTSFTQTGGTAPPPRIEQDLIIGTSIGASAAGFGWLLAAEARHLTESDIQTGNKLHVGGEISLPFMDLRAGLNQGYFTYGAGFDFYFFRIDAASYGEELGAYPGQQVDNRIQIGLTMNFSFDADFNFTDNDQKRKQRR